MIVVDRCGFTVSVKPAASGVRDDTSDKVDKYDAKR